MVKSMFNVSNLQNHIDGILVELVKGTPVGHNFKSVQKICTLYTQINYFYEKILFLGHNLFYLLLKKTSIQSMLASWSQNTS